MKAHSLEKKVSVELSLAHAVFFCNLISEKLSGIPLNNSFSENEKRAVWALEDIIESVLIENGVSKMPRKDWKKLIDETQKIIESLPVNFLP